MVFPSLLLSLCLSLFANPLVGQDWQQLAPLPDPLGVAAPFAGVTAGGLLVAGGANFPEEMPWKGGKKHWLAKAWFLERPGGRWVEAGALPRPRAYGVSVSYADALWCLGGSDASEHSAEVFRMEWKAGRLEHFFSTPLPVPVANAAGAVDAGGQVYIACGSGAPGEQTASNRVFTAILGADPLVWRELPSLPAEPRIFPVAAVDGSAFYIIGGAALEKTGETVSRRYLKDAWRFESKTGWRRLAELSAPVVAAPSPAPVVEGRVMVLGGDDGSFQKGQPLEKHPGFQGNIQVYDPVLNLWETAGKVPVSRVSVPCVLWEGKGVLVSGEVRPGVRSNQIWQFRW